MGEQGLKEKDIFGLFLDHTKTFDVVNHSLILSKT